MTFREHADALQSALVALRRSIHADPEIGLELPRTQERVLEALSGLGLEVTTGAALSSVTAVLRGGLPGPTVLLRGDMDALPVAERAEVEYASRVEGVSHACGHDLHIAMLVGAATVLSAVRDTLPGNVVFMFQPGEEGWDGAGHMIKEGVLEAAGELPVAAYALHVNAGMLPHGVFANRPGATLAASDSISVTVRGRGGHGAAPHMAKDPVPAVCEMVTALQTRVTRSFSPFDPAILTVGSLHAGTRGNVIPETAEFQATVRTFSADARARIAAEAQTAIRGIAAAHGLEVDVKYSEEYPLTVNDPGETEFATQTVGSVFGSARHHELAEPFTASEDFSRVLQEVPGCYLQLGACGVDIDPTEVPYNHSPYATYDDAVLADGAALYAELAWRRLSTATVSQAR